MPMKLDSFFNIGSVLITQSTPLVLCCSVDHPVRQSSSHQPFMSPLIIVIQAQLCKSSPVMGKSRTLTLVRDSLPLGTGRFGMELGYHVTLVKDATAAFSR